MVRDSLFMQTVKLLAQRLGVLDEFYTETACLHPSERELVGYCFAYMTLFGEKDEFSVFLKDFAVPALKKIGISRWPRTEMTDLGLRISDRDEESITLVSAEEEEEEEVRV